MSGNITTFSYYSTSHIKIAKITQIVDEKFTSILNSLDQYDTIQTEIISDNFKRDALIKEEKIPEIENIYHNFVEKFSSDEDSEIEFDSSQIPTIKDVIEIMWDDNTIISCVKHLFKLRLNPLTSQKKRDMV